MKEILETSIHRLLWWLCGLINGIGFATIVAIARDIDMSKAGVSLWVFLAVAAAIVSLQVVPAAILVSCAILTYILKEKK